MDSGASLSYLSYNGLNKLKGIHLSKRKTYNERVVVANGRTEPIKTIFDLPLRIKDKEIFLSTRYLPSLTCDLLLGLDAISTLGLRVDGATQTWQMPGSEESFQFEHPQVSGSNHSCHGISAIDETDQLRVKELVDRYRNQTIPADSHTDLVEHVIDVGDHTPIRQYPYQVNPKLQDIIYQEVDKMFSEGVIENSSSGWSNPIVLVKKPDNSYRFCLDFRKLNCVTTKDAYPIPRMNEILDRLSSSKYISKLDLKSAYWSIPLAQDSKEKTAFAVPGKGLFQFKRMPFGLCNAGATFQRLMDNLFGPELMPSVFVYLDDIIIISENLEHHLKLLEEVFQRLLRAKLRINWDKCEFGVSEVSYLGYRITENGLETDLDKVKPILEYPAPRNVKELRRFLGMCSWYRRFIPSFTEIVNSMSMLLRKEQRWTWTEKQQQAFDHLKSLLIRPPILSRPNFNHPFTLQTDASFSGLGCVLTQTFDNQEHVIAYASRSLQKAELNYTVTEKECLAILFGLKKFRPYIEGYRVTVITDHSALRWLTNLTNPTPRLSRWVLELQGLDLEIIHRKGALNHVPDALSRIPENNNLPVDTICMITQADQRDDLWYNNKKDLVEAHPERYPDYKIENNALYRRKFDSLEMVLEGSTEPWKLVVPRNQINTVLQECHDDSAHFGIQKTYDKLSLRYFFPGMWQSVVKYVKSCLACQQVKSPPEKPPGLMNSTPSERPWQKVYMDCMGPYPRSSANNQYILVIEDSFTKWVELAALRVISSRVICEQFKKLIVYRYGAPQAVVTDNAKSFVSHEMTQLLSQLGVKHIRTPPYHAQANMVERKNKDVKRMLRTYTDARQRNWDIHLQEIAFAANTSVNVSTGFTPAMLNFGRELSPINNTLYNKMSLDNNQQTLPFVPELQARNLRGLKDLYDLVQANQLQSSSRQAKYYDRNHRDVRFHVGDLVMRVNFKLSSAVDHYNAGLAKKFLGPFQVVHCVTPVIYELETEDGFPAGRWHIQHLKPFYRRS